MYNLIRNWKIKLLETSIYFSKFTNWGSIAISDKQNLNPSCIDAKGGCFFEVILGDL